MRKFLAWTFILTTAVALTFVVAKLIGAMEVITVSASGAELVELGDNIVYTEVGESFSIEINQSNKNPNTEVSVSSDNENIVKANEDGTFTAVGGGHTVIRVTTTNIYFRNLKIEVFVGDGSNSSPYYLFNAEQLASIGRPTVDYPNYQLFNSYRLIADINVSSISGGLWKPLDAFSGRFDGNGYTISDIHINKNTYINQFGMEHAEKFVNNGLFSKIEENGAVYNLKIKNFKVTSIHDERQTTIGAVAGINNGKIERIEVIDANITANASYIGGVVGINQTKEISTPVYKKFNARVDQASANVNFGNALAHGITGVIGGIAGKNEGGTVIYSYAVGEVYIENGATYGGIIGENTFIESEFGGYENAKLKDSYSSVKLYIYYVQNPSTVIVGGVIGVNNDKTVAGETINTIMGIYYNINNLNIPESLVPYKVYDGIGKDIIDAVTSERAEAINFVYPYSQAQLAIKDNFISHDKKEIIINSNNEIIRESTVTVKWNFNSIWKIDANTNNGFPTLRYLEINDISTEDYSEYDDFNKVQELYLDEYVLTLGQVFEDKPANGLANIKVYDANDKLVGSADTNYALPVLSDAEVMNFGKSLMVYRKGVLTYKIIAEPASVGYNVVGWARQDGLTNWSQAIECTSDLYLNVKIEKVKIITTAIFNYNGATGPINLPAKQDYTYGEKYGLLPAPIKISSWFEGWFLEPSFKTKVDELSTVTSSEKTHNLYAKWGTVANTHYSIAYNANGGSGNFVDNVLIGNSYKILSNTQVGITRGGHAFLGWATSSSGAIAYTAGHTITPTSNVSLYAKWEVNTSPHSAVALRHNKSATRGALLNVEVNGSIATFTATVDSQYKFIGWYSNSHYTQPQDLVSTSATYSTTLNSTLILYAYWVAPTAQICGVCGADFDGDRCPNERYCSNHKQYHHGECSGKVTCTACGRVNQCGKPCPKGPVYYCPQHGDYHGSSCPKTHTITCRDCGTKYTGNRCPKEKYCSTHRSYYHGKCKEANFCGECGRAFACGSYCPSEKYCSKHKTYYHGSCKVSVYCSICKAYIRCGQDCSKYHRSCYTCKSHYSGSRCVNERYCSTHGIYYHGGSCPMPHVRITITIYFRKYY